jgi:hypothetical protein
MRTMILRMLLLCLVTGAETRYYTFWLTADGRVASFVSAVE